MQIYVELLTNVARLSRRWQNASVTEEWLKQAASGPNAQTRSQSLAIALDVVSSLSVAALFSLTVFPGSHTNIDLAAYVYNEATHFSFICTTFFIAIRRSLCLFTLCFLSEVCTVFPPISAHFFISFCKLISLPDKQANTTCLAYL